MRIERVELCLFHSIRNPDFIMVCVCAHREEFRQGCENLNKLLPSEEKLSGIDHILDLIDFDHSNSIELNEFFEVSLDTHTLVCVPLLHNNHSTNQFVYILSLVSLQAFRLLDLKDGKLDGQIDIQTEQYMRKKVRAFLV